MRLQESTLNIWWVFGRILYFFVAQMGGFPTMCLEIQPLTLVGLDVVVLVQMYQLQCLNSGALAQVHQLWCINSGTSALMN